ncbi:hypothetical protein B0H11DRAFT_1901312 [Mycena galericulata]|nr:hypothetical protein B0H11DRAFT_1938853 [Mycena galericulata]KAJ7509170.1 hypothetical protein B0H11DRAFT_1901312 [Mycena galericulata]
MAGRMAKSDFPWQNAAECYIISRSGAGRRHANFDFPLFVYHANIENLVEKAYQDLNRAIADEEPAAGTAPGSIINGELVDFTELERVERGEAVTVDEDNIDVVGDGGAGGWSIEELMWQ